MKKRFLALALALAMVLPLGTLSAAAEDEGTPAAPAADAAGTLSFENLSGRMLENYYPLLALGENIQTVEDFDYERQENDLRDMLNKLADGMAYQQAIAAAEAANGNAVGAAAITAAGAQLQTQYDALRETFNHVTSGDMRKDNEALGRQLRNMRDQTVIVGESLYITYKELEAGDAAAERAVAQLERMNREMTLRSELGQVSELTAQQTAAGLAQAKSGQATLRMNKDNICLQLKAMTGVGLDEPLTLGALPSVTAQQLADMDLEADLAKAKEASYELFDAKKTYDDALDAYNDAVRTYGYYSKGNGMMSATHTWQAAQYTYENAGQAYELKFRALYAKVKDCAQVLESKRTALALEQEEYEASALKFEQGAISANAFADAQDALAEAKDAVSGAARDLFSTYRSYCWAVEYGILNS